MRLVVPLLIATLALAFAAPVAAGGPTAPVTSTLAPEGLGESFVPGVRLVSELPGGYVEEEFILSGAANNYTYAELPVRDELVLLQTDVPWTTRIIVRRPPDAAAFNGTVVIEWWNSTAQFDTAPVWDPSAEFFVREGWIYVGVTNSPTSIGHLVGGCRTFGLLPPTCGTRYAGLSIPEAGVAFEMGSQIANKLKGNDADRPIPPGYDVERIYHSGQSQQGGSIITYATAFHFPINDGYFVQAASGARPINFLPNCEPSPDNPSPPSYPACTPRVQGADALVATDLPVPLVQAMTETDVPRAAARGSRQPDSENFRYYEMAGVAHTHVHKNVELIPAGFLGGPLAPPLFLEDACLNPLNTGADGPVFGKYLQNAMWANLDRQVKQGIAPPSGELIELDAAGGIARGPLGNAIGGIRLPALEVPIASYTGVNLVDPAVPLFLQSLLGLFCFLTGSSADFDDVTLATLYQNNDDYVSDVHAAAKDLRRDGFLLQTAVNQIVADAEAADVMGEDGCGSGGGAALAILPLAWWRSRRAIGRRQREGRS
ncbi:MAG: hypothetical protein JRH01_16115 [Deltaproteobacteria bacterium]|nr:hypothetical protein [Deltaproteobacteria bacterium]MBW2393314.1 hypothetical protein [Deltaproteobacteria bacterium]